MGRKKDQLTADEKVTILNLLKAGNIGVFNKWRENKRKIVLDFSGVKFSELNLSGANLERATLSGANFHETYLKATSRK